MQTGNETIYRIKRKISVNVSSRMLFVLLVLEVYETLSTKKNKRWYRIFLSYIAFCTRTCLKLLFEVVINFCMHLSTFVLCQHLLHLMKYLENEELSECFQGAILSFIYYKVCCLKSCLFRFIYSLLEIIIVAVLYNMRNYFIF